MTDLRSRVRLALMAAGRRSRTEHLVFARSVLTYLELGSWLGRLAADERPAILADDIAVFEAARRTVREPQPLYLEFGVFEGRSMRWWAEHLDQPGARLIGFDSFEGLPQDWRTGRPRGSFRTTGPPQMSDRRVQFVIGTFEETLPTFELPEHDRLIVNIDCDIYSSTVTVLRWLEPHLRPGTLVYFDELHDRDHELRALQESLDASGRQIAPLAIGRGGVHWLFEYR